MDSAVEPDEEITRPPWGEFGRTFTLAGVTLVGKLTFKVLNSVVVRNQEAVDRYVMQREPGLGLVSVSNHTSTLDDPFVLGAMLPWRYFLTEHQHKGVRWSLCAREICFWNPLLAQFFLNGKTLPIERGEGLHQPIMATAARRVAMGDWLHIFPEGRVNYSGKLGACKWGVGKLICDTVRDGGRWCKAACQPGTPAAGRQQSMYCCHMLYCWTPVILPFYHSGTSNAMPRKAVVPRPGHLITVTVGDPVDVSDLTPRCNCKGEDQAQVWQDITARIRQSLLELERCSPENADQGAHLDRIPLDKFDKRDADPVLPQSKNTE